MAKHPARQHLLFHNLPVLQHPVAVFSRGYADVAFEIFAEK